MGDGWLVTSKKPFPRRILLIAIALVAITVVVALFAAPQLNGPGPTTTSTKSAGTFHLLANPSSLSVPRGSSGNSTIALTSVDGFSGNVDLSVTFTGGSLAVALSPTVLTLAPNGTDTSYLTIIVGTTASIGQYDFTTSAVSGTLLGSTIVHLTVL